MTRTPTATATPACGNGPWIVVSPRPTSERAVGVASDGTYAYAAAGLWGNNFARYNPVTNLWTPLTLMPAGALGPSLVYAPVNNKVYAFRGL